MSTEFHLGEKVVPNSEAIIQELKVRAQRFFDNKN